MPDVDLMSENFSFDTVIGDYKNFFAPACEVVVGTKEVREIVRSGNVQVSNLRVDLPMGDMAGCVSFDVVNAYDLKNGKFDESIISTLKLSEKVQVSLGYGSNLIKVFKGYINSINSDFGTGSLPTLSVTCLDVMGLMMENERDEQRTESMNYSSVVSDLLGADCYTPYLDSSDIVTESDTDLNKAISQQGNDFYYIDELAREIGYEFFVAQGKVYFRKPPTSTSAMITLKWGSGLLSFSREMSARAHICKVVVIGKEKQKTDRVTAEAELSAEQRVKKPGKGITKIIRDETIKTADEAKKRADSELAELEKQSLGGRCACVGLPMLCPGRYIELDGLSPELNDTYYIKNVSHSFGGGGFTTSFDVGVTA